MLILLDLDGVMIPASSWRAVESLNDGFSSFSSIAVNSLNKIIAETGASIMLTTSHKGLFNIPEWLDIFHNRGISSPIDKLEDNLNFSNRKDEILKWLDENNSINFVIIDDDKSLNGLPIHIKNRLVLTDSMVGLTEEKALLAITILKNSFV